VMESSAGPRSVKCFLASNLDRCRDNLLPERRARDNLLQSWRNLPPRARFGLRSWYEVRSEVGNSRVAAQLSIAIGDNCPSPSGKRTYIRVCTGEGGRRALLPRASDPNGVRRITSLRLGPTSRCLPSAERRGAPSMKMVPICHVFAHAHAHVYARS
jgi:hypothetical protein